MSDRKPVNPRSKVRPKKEKDAAANPRSKRKKKAPESPFMVDGSQDLDFLREVLRMGETPGALQRARESNPEALRPQGATRGISSSPRNRGGSENLGLDDPRFFGPEVTARRDALAARDKALGRSRQQARWRDTLANMHSQEEYERQQVPGFGEAFHPNPEVSMMMIDPKYGGGLATASHGATLPSMNGFIQDRFEGARNENLQNQGDLTVANVRGAQDIMNMALSAGTGLHPPSQLPPVPPSPFDPVAKPITSGVDRNFDAPIPWSAEMDLATSPEALRGGTPASDANFQDRTLNQLPHDRPMPNLFEPNISPYQGENERIGNLVEGFVNNAPGIVQAPGEGAGLLEWLEALAGGFPGVQAAQQLGEYLGGPESPFASSEGAAPAPPEPTGIPRQAATDPEDLSFEEAVQLRNDPAAWNSLSPDARRLIGEIIAAGNQAFAVPGGQPGLPRVVSPS